MDRKRNWRRLLFKGNAALLFMLCIGVLLGAAFAAPVFAGWTLPDGTASIFGSAVGAAAAVFGAEWIQLRTEARRRNEYWASALPQFVAERSALQEVITQHGMIKLGDFGWHLLIEIYFGTLRSLRSRVEVLCRVAPDIDLPAAELLSNLDQTLRRLGTQLETRHNLISPNPRNDYMEKENVKHWLDPIEQDLARVIRYLQSKG